jgi:urease accessory protein
MERDARRMRGDGPTVFARVTTGTAVAEIAAHIVDARARALAAAGRGRSGDAQR